MNFQLQFILSPNSNPKFDICSPLTKHFINSLTVMMFFSIGQGCLTNRRPLAKAFLKSVLAGRTVGRRKKSIKQIKKKCFSLGKQVDIIYSCFDLGSTDDDDCMLLLAQCFTYIYINLSKRRFMCQKKPN